MKRTGALAWLAAICAPLWADTAHAAGRAAKGGIDPLMALMAVVILGLAATVALLLFRSPAPPSTPDDAPFDHHPDLILRTDAEGRWLHANHALLALTGLTGQHWQGKRGDELVRLSPLLSGEGAPLVTLSESLWADGESRAEIFVENNSGRKVAYELVRVPLADGKGAFLGTILTGREITHRLDTAMVDERFRRAVEGSKTICLFLRCRDRRVIYGNRSAGAVIGAEQKRLAGMAGERIFPDLEEPAVAIHLTRMTAGEEPSYTFETMLLRRDGRLIPMEVALERVAPMAEEPFFVLTCRDMADQHRADKALRIALGGVARETGDFFFRSLGAALSHNLNLTGVGVARLLNREAATLSTMVLSSKDGLLPSWEGPLESLAATACVTRREPVIVNREQLAHYPDDPLLPTAPDGIRGLPLFNVEGIVIGVLWVGFVGDWQEVGVDDDILKLFALRAGAELERLEAAAALGRSEEKYRKLFEWREWILEHSPEGIVHLDATMRIQFMSPAMGRILGAPESGPVVIGKRIDEIPPMVAAGFAEALAALPLGKEVAVEREYTSLYGKTVYISLKGIPSFENGQFTGAVLMVSDSTEIHQANTALAQSEERLADAQRVAHIGSFEWNFATGEVNYSDELYRILGYEPGAFAPSSAGFAEAVHPDDVGDLQRLLNFDLENRRPFSDSSYRILRPNGEIRHILSRAEYRFDEEGKPLRMLGILHDMTDTEQIQEALRRAQKLESLGLMAGGVAHDFNNLLVGIIGNISLALEEIAENDPAHQTIARSLASARKAADLANQMLAYSGKGSDERSPVCLPPIIEELADFLSAGLPKTVAIDYRLDPQTPLTLGDETQLRQVVMNLVINGAEAIGERDGTVIVTTGAVTLDAPPEGLRFGGDPPPPGVYVTITVEDNGCGMTPEVLERIFDPFFTTKFTGRGLGLAAIRSIVQMTKGYLGVRSQPDVGTVFTVWLPKVASRNDAPAVAPVVAPAEPAGEESWQGGGGVLLVDDEETVRHVARRILTKAGFAVVTAVDGMDGLEKYREAPDRYRLLIIDMTMPRMDGLTLLKHLRDEGCRLPALISSGYDDKRAGAAFAGLEPLSLMRKPYTKGEFLKGVGELLRSTEGVDS